MSIDYKQQYQQTIEQLFFAVRELEEGKKAEELNYLILTKQSEVIGFLFENLDKMEGARKDNAESTMQKLIFVFMHIGKIYLDELKWRKDLFKANQSLLDAAKRIEELEKELIIERQLNMI
tara:strand:+ start:789 stop:1151 length:363 start_codon:yes stop_codon:yes gene_type:complete